MTDEHDPVVTVSTLRAILKSEIKSELNSQLTDLEERLEERLGKRLEKRIIEEGATTRAHFNIMVEKVNESVRLVAEVSSHHATILDDHETRLQKIEKR